MTFAREIRTERLLLRPWRAGDGPRLKAAIDANLDHLRAWMPWAMTEPSPLDVIEARIARFEQEFEVGLNRGYAILAADDERVLGGAGLHRRIESGIEIGYWLDRRELGRGFATEAVRALVAEAFRDSDVGRVQIRCDPRNTASAGVPRRLGFRHLETAIGVGVAPDGSPRDTMIWELVRDRISAAG